MTRLLVSVRSAAEARIALTAGADLIDVKEPHRGALGAADATCVAEVIRTIAGAVPVSAALGELIDLPGNVPLALPGGLSFVKFGLAGCARISDWSACWRQALLQLPAEVRPVAVAYADWRTVAAPPPDEVLRVGLELGCAALLVDTFDKTCGSLVDLWSLAQLSELMAAAADSGLLTVVAGSLDLAAIERVLPLGVDYIAVRGAACGGDRQDSVSEIFVRRLATAVHGTRQVCARSN